MTEPLTAYEERLLGELTAVVSARAAGSPAPIPLAARRRRLVPIGAAVGTVAAAATAFTVLTVGGGTPAYAVERLPNGVGITINDANHLGGLDQKLRDAGLPATVVPIRFGCTDPQPEMIGERHHGYTVRMAETAGNSMRVEIIGPPLPAGETAYIGVLQRTLPNGNLEMRLALELSSRHRSCFAAVPGDERFPAQH